MATDVLEWAVGRFKPMSMACSGALCGAGWWVWGDAVAVASMTGVHTFSAVYLAPGLIATLAVLVMNCVPRSEVVDSVYGDDATMCRSRLTLFLSYVFAVAGIMVGVGILLNMKAQGQHDEQLWIGAAGILQPCLIVASGLVAWFFRESEDEGYMGYA